MKKSDRFVQEGHDVSAVQHSQVKVGTTYAGYGTVKMVSDINGIFKAWPKGGTFNELHEVVGNTFESTCLDNFKYGKGSELPSNARNDAIQHYKFFKRFSHSALREMLLGQSDGDADAATKLFFEQGGGEGDIGDLQELAAKSRGELEEMFGGRLAGHGGGNMKAWLDLKKLVKHISKDWDFSGEVSSVWRDTPYPAEDVQYESMKSYQQLPSVPLSSFMVPELFKLNLATKQMQVRKFRERVPGPPKRFMVIIDDSGSMFSPVNRPVAGTMFTGAAWATAIAIAICQAAEGTSNKVAVAFFCDYVHGTKRGEFFEGNARQAEAWLWKARWDGGGTNLTPVLTAANSFHEKCEPVEACILITDCACNYAEIKPLMPFYTVSTEGPQSYDSYAYLKRISQRIIDIADVHMQKIEVKK